MDKKEIGKKIATYRKLLGLSQKNLSDKSGISVRMIAYYESGKHNISTETLFKISESLNINISSLLEKENKKKFGIENLDVRWVKKIYEIKNLPERDQKAVVNYINMLIEKRQKRKAIPKQFHEVSK